MMQSDTLFDVETDISNPPFALPPEADEPRRKETAPEALTPTEVRFTIPGKAVAKGRPRATRSGRMFTPAKTANAEAFIRHLAHDAMQGRPPLIGPVQMTIEVAAPVPASWPKRKQAAALSGAIMPTARPDLDNLCKLVSDALNGICFADDSQVVRLLATKTYGLVPQTIVTVCQLNPALVD
jgi:Holliday junction resolvase RusA-like endonuclease